MRTVNQEEQLARIADALESINSNLSEIALSLNNIDKNIDDCIVSPARGGGRLLQITGNVFTQ